MGLDADAYPTVVPDEIFESMRGISGPCFFKRKWQCMIVIRQPRFNLLSRCIASLSKPVDQIRPD